MIRLALAVVALTLVGLAIHSGPSAVHAAPDSYEWADLNYKADLHCDGDQTRFSVRVVNAADGRPASGVSIRFNAAGAFSGSGTTTPSDAGYNVYTDTTDRNGLFRVRLAPAASEIGVWIGVVTIVDASGDRLDPYPLQIRGNCDFTSDPANHITGEMFVDEDADGHLDDGERAYRNKLIGVRASGTNWGNFIGLHEQRADSRGTFDWRNVPYTDHPLVRWDLCVSDRANIVSVNGILLDEPVRCYGFRLEPGVNRLVVGVQHLH